MIANLTTLGVAAYWTGFQLLFWRLLFPNSFPWKRLDKTEEKV